MTVPDPAPHPEPADKGTAVTEPPCKKMRVSELLGLPQPIEVAPDENKTFLTTSGEWTAAEAISKAMPHDRGLPLTILTGFLGAGKSTVLNFILKADHGLNIAVLINEYGKVDIDNQLVDTVSKGEEGEPVVLNNGCICCTVSGGFMDAVKRVLEQAEANDRIPDYFIVETTGLADPKPIIDSVSNTELNNDLYVDQVLTVVDCSAWTDDHYDSDTALSQISKADTVLLSKTDLVDEARIKEVVQSVLDIRSNARILRSQRGYVPIAALFDLGVSLSGKKRKTWALKPASAGHTDGDGKPADEKHDHGHEKHDHGHHKHDDPNHVHDKNCGHSHDHKKKSHLEEEGFTSISFVCEQPFSLRRFRTDFMNSLPRGVFRSKGLLWFNNYDSRFVFHLSGARFHVDEQEWPEDAERKNQLVVIGRELDRAKITKMLEDCVIKPGEEEEEEDLDEYEDGEEEYMGYDGNDEDDDDEDTGEDGVPAEQDAEDEENDGEYGPEDDDDEGDDDEDDEGITEAGLPGVNAGEANGTIETRPAAP